MKKGFTLVETIIAMAVIGIIASSFFTLANFSNTTHLKSTLKTIGALQIESVQNVFLASSLSENGQFSLTDFEKKLEPFYNVNITQENNYYFFGWSINQNWQQSESGDSLLEFQICHENKNATLSAKILLNQKTIYQFSGIKKAVGI